MNTIRLALLVALLLLVPQAAFAHATPVDMQPHSGAQLAVPPAEISITFSEHLERGSSLVRVSDEKGVRVDTGGAVVAADGRTLSTQLRAHDGLYTVSWSVVSKDDGHFTRGSYAFAVGSTSVSAAASEEMVKIATTKEAGLMFVEFFANSLLWGMLALFLLSRGDERLRRPFIMLSIIALLSALVADLGHILLKAHELAVLHQSGFSEAFSLYVHTTAGFATILRALALAVGAAGVAMFGFRSVRGTAAILIPALAVFAYFRAIVSHATANPFHPGLSIAVNFIHVIEKDLWLGLLAVLCVLFFMRPNAAREYVHGVVNLLSANLAVLAVSAGYIVWLHLRSFDNLASTAWGQAAIPLFAAALALVVVHASIVLLGRYRARASSRLYPSLIGAETAAAALVVFFTSIVIITSPPSTAAEPLVLSGNSNGVRVELSRDQFEDGKALLVIEGADAAPTVFIGDRDGGLLVPLAKRFVGGYVFPSGLVTKPDRVSVIVPQSGSYDADVTFEVTPEDFAVPQGHGRRFDAFTLSMIALVCFGVLLSLLLSFIGRRTVRYELAEKRHTLSLFAGAVVSYVSVAMLCLVASHVLLNRFQATCEYEGNMWHMMQPTKAGTPVASGAQEGCMWGMGDKAYFFADSREYDYLNTLGPATVSLTATPRIITAGVPTDLRFSLQNEDGTPATLLIDMEKYLHVVIISEDQTVFAHLHPDDNAPLTQEAIDRSVYTVRYTFPKSGTYLVSTDYAHGTQLESKQFRVDVVGGSGQRADARTYPSPGAFGGYTVSMDHGGAFAGEVTTLKFSVTKDGAPVTDMKPYLSAVSHISVVKNDLSAFVHTHGEVHALGTPYPPIVVRNGKIIHSMSAMTSPSSFGPAFEAHVLFPSEGRYTVWAQINVGGRVIPTSFTVDVE